MVTLSFLRDGNLWLRSFADARTCVDRINVTEMMEAEENQGKDLNLCGVIFQNLGSQQFLVLRGGQKLNLPTGTGWRQIFGPFLLHYCPSDEDFWVQEIELEELAVTIDDLLEDRLEAVL